MHRGVPIRHTCWHVSSRTSHDMQSLLASLYFVPSLLISCPCDSHEAKMSFQAPPDACFLTAAYLRDGAWYCEHLQVQVVVAVLNVVPSPQSSLRPDYENEEVGTSVLRFPASSSDEVLRVMCTSKLGEENTLQLEKDLVVKVRKIHELSSCRVQDGQRFGKLMHWSRLLDHTRGSNIVVFLTSHNKFFVVSAKGDAQAVHLRSALCWLRVKAGLGFSFDKSGGVFCIRASRRRSTIDDDCLMEDIAKLVSSIPEVFPAATFDEHL
jgi:hypothetical protein